MPGISADCTLEDTSWKALTELPFRPGLCLSFLCESQNADGGWGYHPGAASNAEATAWALLALRERDGAFSGTLERGTGWLRSSQRPSGPWYSAGDQHAGTWVTSLACLALLGSLETPSPAVVKGLEWLCATWPAEGGLWRRFQKRWRRKSPVIVRQDDALRGWSWTPGTASWVEPTASVLILLQSVPNPYLPSAGERRMRLGERMLYDRVCPGGGWNAGNPLVYGVPGVPRIGPTAWALLALRSHSDRPENLASLEWLARSYESIQGPASLALAHLCLNTYGRPSSSLEARLQDLYRRNHFFKNIVTLSQAILALGAVPRWLGSPAEREESA